VLDLDKYCSSAASLIARCDQQEVACEIHRSPIDGRPKSSAWGESSGGDVLVFQAAQPDSNVESVTCSSATDCTAVGTTISDAYERTVVERHT
jgi:hypothetical protein